MTHICGTSPHTACKQSKCTNKTLGNTHRKTVTHTHTHTHHPPIRTPIHTQMMPTDQHKGKFKSPICSALPISTPAVAAVTPLYNPNPPDTHTHTHTHTHLPY